MAPPRDPAGLAGAWEARLEGAWRRLTVARQVVDFLSTALRRDGKDRRIGPAAGDVSDWLLAMANVKAARQEYDECFRALEVIARESARSRSETKKGVRSTFPAAARR